MAFPILKENLMDLAGGLFLFDGLHKQQIQEAITAEGCQAFFYQKGEIIFEPEDFQRKLGWIAQGSIRVYGGQVLLNIIGQGGVFGAAALFGQYAGYSSRILAASDCKILFFSEALIRRLVMDNGQIAVNYVSFLSDRIRFLNRKIATFTADSAKSRLLQYLISQAGQQACTEGTITLPVSCQRLAESLNIGRASLYRAFEQLESDGLIRKTGKTVTIYTTM